MTLCRPPHYSSSALPCDFWSAANHVIPLFTVHCVDSILFCQLHSCSVQSIWRALNWASLNTTFMGHFLKCCSVDKHNFNNLSWTKVLVEKYSLDRYSTNVLGVVWVNNVDMLRRCIWICMRYLRTQYLCVLNIYVSRYRMCTMDWCWGSFSPYNILQYYSQGKHLSLCVLHSRDSRGAAVVAVV